MTKCRQSTGQTSRWAKLLPALTDDDDNTNGASGVDGTVAWVVNVLGRLTWLSPSLLVACIGSTYHFKPSAILKGSTAHPASSDC